MPYYGWLALLQLPNWVVVFKYWLVTVALVLVSGGKITRIDPLVNVKLLTFFLVYLTSHDLKLYYYDACDIN
jgi:hypothetical protein